MAYPLLVKLLLLLPCGALLLTSAAFLFAGFYAAAVVYAVAALFAYIVMRLEAGSAYREWPVQSTP